MDVTIANAPISYGAFELTVGIDPSRARRRPSSSTRSRAPATPASTSARSASSATGPVLAERLASAGPRPGRRVPGVPLLRPRGAARASTPSSTRCSTPSTRCAGASRAPTRARPSPTPAATERRAAPGRSHADRSRGLDAAGWARFGDGPARGRRAVSRPRLRADLAPRDRDLGRGALGDRARPWSSPTSGCASRPVTSSSAAATRRALARDWSGRINHVHVKDALPGGDRRRSSPTTSPTPAIWSREAFCALGDGDVDLGGVFAALAADGFAGWMVVEQDIFPQAPERFAQAIEDQHAQPSASSPRRGL